MGECVWGEGLWGGVNNIGCGAGVGWDNMQTVHPTFKTIHPTFKTMSSTSSPRNTCCHCGEYYATFMWYISQCS